MKVTWKLLRSIRSADQARPEDRIWFTKKFQGRKRWSIEVGLSFCWFRGEKMDVTLAVAAAKTIVFWVMQKQLLVLCWPRPKSISIGLFKLCSCERGTCHMCELEWKGDRDRGLETVFITFSFLDLYECKIFVSDKSEREKQERLMVCVRFFYFKMKMLWCTLLQITQKHASTNNRIRSRRK